MEAERFVLSRCHGPCGLETSRLDEDWRQALMRGQKSCREEKEKFDLLSVPAAEFLIADPDPKTRPRFSGSRAVLAC